MIDKGTRKGAGAEKEQRRNIFCDAKDTKKTGDTQKEQRVIRGILQFVALGKEWTSCAV